jgi:hypothetical protein
MGVERFKPQSPDLARQLASMFPDKKEFVKFEEWSAALKPNLFTYIDLLNRKLFPQKSAERFTEEEGIKALDLMGRNYLIANILTTHEYEEIIAEEKKLRGSIQTTIGVSRCIDGRLPNQDNRLLKIHESKAGLLETEEIYDLPSRQKKRVLKSGRMREAIIGEADKGPLLQILLAHTNIASPEEPCDCGAMLALEKKFPKGTDLLQVNLNLHQNAASAIDMLYNEEVTNNIIEYNKQEEVQKNKNKKNRIPQIRTAITAVYETSSQGIVLGYGEAVGTLSTTQLAREIAEQYNSPYFGALEGKSLDITSIVSNKRMILDVTKILLDPTSSFMLQTVNYIENSPILSDLNVDQRQALIFYLGRTTAIQLLTRSYDPNTPNPYRKHNEEFLAISSEEATVGEIFPGQVFCATPHTKQAVDHVKTQCTLMDHYQPDRDRPDILFISNSQVHGVSGAHKDASKGDTLEMLTAIYRDKKIKKLIRNHQLLPIPVIIDEKTRVIKYLFNAVGAF